MKGLDTNVLVRYFTQDDPAQSRKANAAIDDAVARGERLFINSIVLCELVWVLREAYRYEKEILVMILDRVLATAQFSLQHKDPVQRALEEYRTGAGDFSDYLIGELNRESGCDDTATFDKNLKKSGLFEVL